MNRNPQSGITQLELLISLGIMTLIAVLLANAFNFNRQSLDRSMFLSSRTEALISQNQLRRMIELIPLDYDGNTASAYFIGMQDQITFISPELVGGLDRLETTLRLLPGETQTLFMQQSRSDSSETTNVLRTDISSFSIAYYGRISSEPEKRWHTAWQDPVFLPDLLKIEWKTKDGKALPPFTAVPGGYQRQREMSASSLVPPG